MWRGACGWVDHLVLPQHQQLFCYARPRQPNCAFLLLFKFVLTADARFRCEEQSICVNQDKHYDGRLLVLPRQTLRVAQGVAAPEIVSE